MDVYCMRLWRLPLSVDEERSGDSMSMMSIHPMSIPERTESVVACGQWGVINAGGACVRVGWAIVVSVTLMFGVWHFSGVNRVVFPTDLARLRQGSNVSKPVFCELFGTSHGEKR